MKQTCKFTNLRLLLACGTLIAGLAACGKQKSQPYVPASRPLPDGVEISFKYSLFDTNDILRPYAPADLFVSPPVMDEIPKDSTIWLDADSRLDGRPIPEEVIKYLEFGQNSLNNQVFAKIGPSFQPWRLLPRRPGTYTVELVLQTQTEKWVCPPLVLTIRASEEETALLAEFESSGASRFLDHPTGARWSREPEAPPLPYDALADFVSAHPDSYLTGIVLQRIWRIHLRDLNSCGKYDKGPLVSEDRVALATILGRFDPHFKNTFADFQKGFEHTASTSAAADQIEQLMDINNEWLRIATAASEKQETSR